MTQKTVSDFFQEIKTDNVLREQLESASGETIKDSHRTVQVAPQDILRIARGRGYEFKEEELQAYVKEYGSDGELSMGELESVAGGGVTITITIVIKF
jgi:predicted ribosomally synthesized peptide with nif11-like leader